MLKSRGSLSILVPGIDCGNNRQLPFNLSSYGSKLNIPIPEVTLYDSNLSLNMYSPFTVYHHQVHIE